MGRLFETWLADKHARLGAAEHERPASPDFRVNPFVARLGLRAGSSNVVSAERQSMDARDSGGQLGSFRIVPDPAHEAPPRYRQLEKQRSNEQNASEALKLHDRRGAPSAARSSHRQSALAAYTVQPAALELRPFASRWLMNRQWLGCFVLCMLSSHSALAQLWGSSPFQNGPSVPQGGLYQFDPDSLTWLDGKQLTLAGFSVTGIDSIVMHPKDPPGTPPEQRRAGTAYALLKVSAISGRVLATVDLTTGIATQVANLGDQFSSLAFREDGQLFGVTDDSATSPEVLYRIDKFDGSKTLAVALGAGLDGEVIAFNPDDDRFYHWSGTPNIVFEKLMSVPPYSSTNIPVIGSQSDEVYGAVWDPCRQRNIAGTQQLAFIASKYNTTAINGFLNVWGTGGELTTTLGTSPDALRGLALVGGYTCEVDLGIGAGAPERNRSPNAPMSVLLVVDNAGPARAIDPIVTITLPSSLTAVTTSGCLEDPSGVPTCTLRMFAQRYQETPSPGYAPFQVSSLWTGRSTTVTLNGDYDGTGGFVHATVTSGSQETQAQNNTVQYRLGNVLFADSFE